MEYCVKCKEYKEITEFPASKAREVGFNDVCKACNAKAAAEWRKQSASKPNKWDL